MNVDSCVLRIIAIQALTDTMKSYNDTVEKYSSWLLHQMQWLRLLLLVYYYSSFSLRCVCGSFMHVIIIYVCVCLSVCLRLHQYA